MKPLLSLLILGTVAGLTHAAKQPDLETQSAYYTLESFPLPEGEVLEVGSIALVPDSTRIGVTTRRGDLWVIDEAYGPVGEARWSKFAQGLHEPFGMFWQDGGFVLTQRPEVTWVGDTDGDDRADLYRRIGGDWGINGDYHEYAFGTEPDADGNIWIVLCLTGSGSARSDFRGWGVRVTPDGRTIPTASGVRSPGGIGFNAAGDVFYTDNQGLWNGSSSLKHLKPSGFMGNPTGNIYYELTDAIGPRPVDPVSGSRMETERARIPELVPPAVVLPHRKVGQSPTAVITDTTNGAFGPFAGQVLVGEQFASEVQRVCLEQVNGVYQGAVFRFLEGFSCGIVPMRLAEEGTLFVGGTNRGWGSHGDKPFSLERVRWTGTVPFEIHTMSVTPQGFDLTFTQPVDATTAGDPSSYAMSAWTYMYQKGYGSPEVDTVTPEVTSATVSEDGLRVSLVVTGRVKGHVHELSAEGVRNAEGKALWHPVGWYTLNEIPAK